MAKYLDETGAEQLNQLLAAKFNTKADKTEIPTKTSELTNDSGFGTYSKPTGGIPKADLSSDVQTSLGLADTALQGMTILSYGSSTWNDFIAAYNNKSVVYCRASSNSNPATGSQTRLAFMAYVNNAENPTEVEFQYYRSVNSHTDSQQGDQVYVYKLNSSGTWTVTVRNAFSKVVTGTNMSSSYSNGVITLEATDTTYESKAAASGGTDVSLVTTGEKYTWNNKGSGTITKVQANGTDVASSGTANIPAASTSAYGVTKLSSATDSTSEVLAATPKAVKAAYDLAAGKGTGTITGVSVNGTSVATSGVANITSVPASILSGAIPSAVTATTQGASDNSTKIATTAFVKTAINALPTFINNLKDGTATGSLRTVGSDSESSSYTLGTYAFAEGRSSMASGSSSHAEGTSTKAIGYYSHAEGYNTQATNDAAHAEGYSTQATHRGTHAEGYCSKATSVNSHAEGSYSVSMGDASHAEGYTIQYSSGTIGSIDKANLQLTVNGLPEHYGNYLRYVLSDKAYATGDYSIENSSRNSSSGAYTFTVSQWNSGFTVGAVVYIFGVSCTKGTGSHSEGLGTYAADVASHSEGKGTIATAQAQHVEGTWNIINSNLAHIVGNGTDNANRSNAYTLDWNGNGVYAGKLTVGTGPSNNMDVATKKYVDDSLLALPEPMIFKGSLGTGGTITTLPTASASNEGYTYKVITAGTYASQSAKVGDTFISDGSIWVLIPSGDEPSGTVTSVKIEATGPIAVNDNSAITTSGTRTISHSNSGVTAGRYRSVTVNDTGHVTAGTNPTTISDYGITDAKITNGTITLGSDTITPLTDDSTLDATKVSGTLPTNTYTDTKNTAGSTDSSSRLYLIGATSQAVNPQTYSDDEIYVESGSLTIGTRKTGTIGTNSFTQGKDVLASNNYSHAEGWGSTASSNCSHAEGYNTTASGSKSHAEGTSTTASNNSSHAEGSYTTASGNYSHAEGYYTTASNDDSHAEGDHTVASGRFSHAEGYYTTAQRRSQHIQGEYNILDTAGTTTTRGTYAHIVGNGTADNARSNAHTLDWSGNAWYAGDIYIGSTSGTNKDSGSKKLATEDFVTSQGYVTTDTKNTAGSTDTSSKIYLVGATEQSANPQTYSDNEVFVQDGVINTQEATIGTRIINSSIGTNSFAQGQNVEASGNFSHAEGQYTAASGINSHAEGQGYYEASNVLINDYSNPTTDTDPSGRVDIEDQTGSGAIQPGGELTINGHSYKITQVTPLSDEWPYMSCTIEPGLTLNDAASIVKNETVALYETKLLVFASGQSSHAEGGSTSASGAGSHAEGIRTRAEGDGSHAEGEATTASRRDSHAEGYGTIASGGGSHAEGYQTTASSSNSHAEGAQTTASGDFSHAEGQSTTASGNCSHAEGWRSTASSSNSHAEGAQTTASGYGSHAEGFRTIASGQNAHAEGIYAYASGYGSHAEGACPDDEDSYLGIIVLTGDANATTYTTTNTSNVKIGYYIRSPYDEEGAFVTGITANSSITLNRTLSTSAISNEEYYIYETTIASGEGSHAEGYGTIASGKCSHAGGWRSTASKDYSYAQGSGANATGQCSHAEGQGTTASGDRSHAEGYQTTASGTVSHAEGSNTTASGSYSHAESYYTTASGSHAHAEGYYTTAQRKSQHTQGEYNILDTSGTTSTRGTYAHIVGNGTSNSKRSNAYTLDWSGNAWFAGDVYVGSTSGTNKDAGSKKLATENYVTSQGYITTDTKNTAGSTDTSSKIYLIGATEQSTNPQTYSDNEVYTTNGTLTAKEFSLGTNAKIVYNTSESCIEFSFS